MTLRYRLRSTSASLAPRRAIVLSALASALVSVACHATSGRALTNVLPASGCPSTTRSDTAEQVEWHRPTDDDRLDQLEAWCESVGPPVFRSRPQEAGEISPRHAGDTFVLVSWNIHVGQGSVPELVGEIRRRFGPETPFVLLLQEALRRGTDVPFEPPTGLALPRAIRPRHGQGDDIVATARLLNLALLYAPSMRNGDDRAPEWREDRGNAILSTEPLTDPRIIELPLGRQRRAAVAARVTSVPALASSFDVFSAHLDGPDGGDQADVLAAFLAGVAGRAPVVVGADLNTLLGPIDPRVRTVARAVGRRECGGRTYLRLLLLDHIFSNLPVSVRSCEVQDDRYGSDHAPILMEVGTTGARR